MAQHPPRERHHGPKGTPARRSRSARSGTGGHSGNAPGRRLWRCSALRMRRLAGSDALVQGERYGVIPAQIPTGDGGATTLATMAHAHRRPAAHPLLTAVTVALALAILVGMVMLWPSDVEQPAGADLLRRGQVVEAEVTSIAFVPCGSTNVTTNADIPPPPPEAPPCRAVDFVVAQGLDEGKAVTIELPEQSTAPDLEEGETVLLERPPVEVPGVPYAFYDQIRTPSLFWLAIVFSVLVVLLGKLRGLAALVGLAISIAILLAFVIPAILEGTSPVLVASVGAGAIGFIVLYLAHGFTGLTTVAVLGTLTGVGLTLVLSLIWTPIVKLTGLASDSAFIVQAVGADIDLSGLLLAGIVIGALGAIDDVAVTQASTVWELRSADPELGYMGLFRAGMRVGRDHVGSIVNTLALAYAGASLPLLILFQLSRQPLGQLVGSEIVATEIVRTLVGSIGLVAAMPVTTWLAAFVVAREPAESAGVEAGISST